MSNKLINKIICGDCLEVMNHFPDKLVDLVVTSPPYNMRLRVRSQLPPTKVEGLKKP